MKSFLYIFILPIIILSSLLIFGLIKSNETDDLRKKLSKQQDAVNKIRSDQHLEELFSTDLNVALGEWESWSKVAKTCINFWNDYLNSNENLYINHKVKSSSAINTEINKLISYLNRSCKAKQVSFRSLEPNDYNLFNQNAVTEKSFGFGFSAYDGFWPSFNKNEANIIFIQSNIVKELTEYLLDSFAGESFTFISLKRESAGETDASHINGDRLFLPNNTPLLRRKGLVKSYLFEISFSGKTTHCRSFINQLRPPYSLRKLQVLRHEKTSSQTDDSFFISNNTKKDSEILPIIRDITSIFTLEIEYIYEVSNDLKPWLLTELNAIHNPLSTEVLLSYLD